MTINNDFPVILRFMKNYTSNLKYLQKSEFIPNEVNSPKKN